MDKKSTVRRFPTFPHMFPPFRSAISPWGTLDVPLRGTSTRWAVKPDKPQVGPFFGVGDEVIFNQNPQDFDMEVETWWFNKFPRFIIWRNFTFQVKQQSIPKLFEKLFWSAWIVS